MDKQQKIEQLKKVLTKASKLEKGKELMVAEELIQIDDKSKVSYTHGIIRE